MVTYLTTLTFGYQKRFVIGSSNVCILLKNVVEDHQNAHYLQLDILEIKWWDFGE